MEEEDEALWASNIQNIQDYLSEMKVLTEFQKTVGTYKVDLYIPDYNIALEIDEHGHSDRDPHYEMCREEFIRRELRCDFIRVNPDEQDFNIFKMLGRLANHILAHHCEPGQ